MPSSSLLSPLSSPSCTLLQAEITAVAVSADNATLFVGARDRVVAVHDAASGAQLREIKLSAAVTSVACSTTVVRNGRVIKPGDLEHVVVGLCGGAAVKVEVATGTILVEVARKSGE